MDTNTTNIMVTGQVIQGGDETGKAGLLVTAMENSAAATTPAGVVSTAAIVLGTAKTDETGRFRMAVNDANLRRGIAPDLFFNVYDLDGKTLLASTFDYVVWNGSTQEDVTIKLRSKQVTPPLGIDRVTALQARQAGTFLAQSDFKGVMNQVKSQVNTSFSVLGNSIMDSISKFDFTPLKVSVPSNSIVNNDVKTAGQQLNAQNIPYQVMDYQPGLNKELLQSIMSVQPDLKPGESINLYQEDGIVKYYSIVTANKVAPVNPVAPITPVVPVDVVKPSRLIKTETPASVSVISTDHSADIDNLKKELNTTKVNAAEKDKQIANLTKQLEAIRKEQLSLKKMFSAQTRK